METELNNSIQSLVNTLNRIAKGKPSSQSYEIPLAAHLVSPRRFRALTFTHHGIYIGEGRVIHYSGFSEEMASGPVAETTLYDFSFGEPIHVLNYPDGAVRYSPEEIIERARSRMGEDKYDLIRNNCEHFVEWCCTGENIAYQNRRLWTKVLLASELVASRTGSYILRRYGRKLIRRYVPEKLVSVSFLAVDALTLGVSALRIRKHLKEAREHQFRLGPPLRVLPDQSIELQHDHDTITKDAPKNSVQGH